jgi:hypothetical protein
VRQHQLGDLRLGPCRQYLPRRRRVALHRCAAPKSALVIDGCAAAGQQAAVAGAGGMSVAAAAAARGQRRRQHVDLDRGVRQIHAPQRAAGRQRPQQLISLQSNGDTVMFLQHKYVSAKRLSPRPCIHPHRQQGREAVHAAELLLLCWKPIDTQDPLHNRAQCVHQDV